jgi:hypothetical protein
MLYLSQTRKPLSYQISNEVLNVLNNGLLSRYEEGNPIRLNVSGRPKFHILSFTPIDYEKYGFFRNRAPNVVGLCALRAFLIAPHSEGVALLIAGVETGRECYGFVMDGCHESTRQTMTSVASILGHPDLRLNPI